MTTKGRVPSPPIKDSRKPWAVLILDGDHRLLVEHTAYFRTRWGARRYRDRLGLREFTAKVVSNR